MSRRTDESTVWWRIILHSVAGPIMIDDSESREDALARADEMDRGRSRWPMTQVIEITERGRDHDSEYIR